MTLRELYEQKCNELCCEPIHPLIADLKQAEADGCAGNHCAGWVARQQQQGPALCGGQSQLEAWHGLGAQTPAAHCDLTWSSPLPIALQFNTCTLHGHAFVLLASCAWQQVSDPNVCREVLRAIRLNGNSKALFHRRVSNVQLMALSEALADNRDVEYLDVSHNDGTPAARHGEPDAATFGNEGAATIARMIKMTKGLKYIMLEGNAIGPEGAKAIATAIQSSGSAAIEVLNIAANPVLDEVRYQSLRQPTQGVPSSPFHIRCVRCAMHRQVRCTLFPRRSEGRRSALTTPGLQGAEAIADMLECNRSMRILDLGNCGLRPGGLLAIIASITVNTTLETIGLEDAAQVQNPPQQQTTRSLAHMLATNNTLRQHLSRQACPARLRLRPTCGVWLAEEHICGSAGLESQSSLWHVCNMAVNFAAAQQHDSGALSGVESPGGRLCGGYRRGVAEQSHTDRTGPTLVLDKRRGHGAAGQGANAQLGQQGVRMGQWFWKERSLGVARPGAT